MAFSYKSKTQMLCFGSPVKGPGGEENAVVSVFQW